MLAAGTKFALLDMEDCIIAVRYSMTHSPLSVERRSIMLYWAAVFFIIALIAGVFGFGGIAAGAVEIAKILFFIFIVVFLVTLVLGLFRR